MYDFCLVLIKISFAFVYRWSDIGNAYMEFNWMCFVVVRIVINVSFCSTCNFQYFTIDLRDIRRTLLLPFGFSCAPNRLIDLICCLYITIESSITLHRYRYQFMNYDNRIIGWLSMQTMANALIPTFTHHSLMKFDRIVRDFQAIV